ncbi:hypothetical protein RCG19_11980 [Neobacillus sp. OS1-2]|uniref:hypothetical protein n=1 Tax=Neobacillus sp. OS1-2 TaxID=3070680 RepID=UPI0027DF64A2|nr:hypothetical protein [Neobacillus sp. OS1-2]WML37967.1 hypothetical protein RCG19_11980 [Neobacillus sp. OS1-2]
MLKKKLVVGTLALGLLAPTVASAAYNSYVGYSLPPLGGNNYTYYHTKATNDDYIHNIVENIDGAANAANFWAEDKTLISSGTISQKYKQTVGSAQTIKFLKNESAGTNVRMAMENYSLKLNDYGFVAGRVDFR